MTPPPRLPRLLRWLLALAFLGDRRADVESDLAELYADRAASRGRVHAAWRLAHDVTSLALRPRKAHLHGTHLRSALRLFRRHRAPVIVTAGGLGLAIAVCTSVFSILNAVVLRPYGIDDPASLVRLHRLHRQSSSTSWPYSAFTELHARAATPIEASAADTVHIADSPGESAAQADSMLFVSGGYLQTLGGRALIGRTLAPADDDLASPPVVVLNHAFWKLRFSADRTIVGRTIWLNGAAVTVAGVLEPRFEGPTDKPPALWAAFGAYGQIFSTRPITRESALGVDVFARVPPGTSRAAAQDQLSAVATELTPVLMRQDDASPRPVTGVRAEPAGSRMDSDDGASLWFLVIAVGVVVGLVLMVACANAGNLLLAGAMARNREIGVRMALGASRGQIMQLLLTESAVIGLAAGAAGFMLSVWLMPSLAVAIGLPSTYDVVPDRAAFLFASVLAIATGLGAGLAPARLGARGDLVSALNTQSGQTTRPKAAGLRRWFIAIQAAASMLLVVMAGLLARSALHVSHVDLGFDADRLVTATIAGPGDNASDGSSRAFWARAAERVGAVPRVERVSFALYPPFSGAVSITEIDRGGSDFRMYENNTDENYFAAAGIRVVRGRTYSADEAASNAPVAVVSASIAKEFFANGDAIGGSLTDIFTKAPRGISIIGVVADSVTRLTRGREGMLYRPIAPTAWPAARMVVRSEQPRASAHDIAAVLRSVDPRARATVDIVADNAARRLNEPAILATLAASVAALAVALAALGMYGVTAFVVSQRAREVSVRMAIGATSADVVRLLVRQSLIPVALGFAIGLAGAIAAGRALTEVLFGISPYDPVAIGCAGALLGAIAFVAIAGPARRAAKANPASVLKG